MVFIALNKECNSSRIEIMSRLCHSQDITMKPKDFVEDVLCKDPEFKLILENHGFHSEQTKNLEWTCNSNTVEMTNDQTIKLQRCQLNDPGDLSQDDEEKICRNYLHHHQDTHNLPQDQNLGLSYHARLCDYRILSKSKQKDQNVMNQKEMHDMELKCCLQRLQMASYLRHKTSLEEKAKFGYSSPLVCHAVHKATNVRPQEFNIKLRYPDKTHVTVQILYKTNTKCLLRIH